MSETKNVTSRVLLASILISLVVSSLVTYGIIASQPKPTSTGTAGFVGPGLFLVTRNDTTAFRAFNTTYQATLQGGNGNAMLVTVIAWMNTSYGQPTSRAAITAFIAPTLNPNGGGITFCNCYFSAAGTHHVFSSGVFNNSGNYGEVAQFNVTAANNGDVATLNFWVPWRYYYMVNDTHIVSIAPTLKAWIETIQPTGFGTIITAVLQDSKRYF